MKDSSGRQGRGGRVRLRYLVGIAAAGVIVALLIALGALGRGGDGNGGGGPVVLPSPRPSGIAQEGHVLGSSDAPVAVIEYADFQ